MKRKVIYEEKFEKDSKMALTPYEYFNNVKDCIQEMDEDKLEKIYNNVMNLANLYKRTGQNSALRKLLFHLKSISK